MNSKEDDFLQLLRETFRVEAGEHLQTIAAGLLDLEKTTDPEERRHLISLVFRAAHSLKGAARAVNLMDVESICQTLEDVFADWRQLTTTPSAGDLDVVHSQLDEITELLLPPSSPSKVAAAVSPVPPSTVTPATTPQKPAAGSSPAPPASPTPVTTATGTKAAVPPAQPPTPAPTQAQAQSPTPAPTPSHSQAPTPPTAASSRPATPAPVATSVPLASSSESTLDSVAAMPPQAAKSPTPRRIVETKSAVPEDTVRISVAKLDARLMEAEEMLAAKLAVGQLAMELRHLGHAFAPWHSERSAVEPEIRSLRQALDRATTNQPPTPAQQNLSRVLDFLEWSVTQVRTVEDRVSGLTRTAEQDHHHIGKLVDDLLNDSKKLLLMPFGTIAAPLPRVVRDLCRDQGKTADLVLHGEDVELDKRILEEMKDPLVHLLRNCVDHGIESPDVRARLGKPERATISLTASQIADGKVEIVVADDGAGINAARVKESAIKHQQIGEEEARQLDATAAIQLIFKAEVTTSPIITRLSGRGLGLAIVREKAERLGGSVTVETQPGVGTTFRLTLPAMRATFRGILVQAESRIFVVPTAHVERVTRARPDDIHTVEGRETIVTAGRTVAWTRLADVLALPPAASPHEPPSATPALILGGGDLRIAFAVDAVLDEQEVLVKQLGSPLIRVRHVAGATVLGNGQVAPVLNVADLLRTARKVAGMSSRPAAVPIAPSARSLLVAEDSITSRMLIKSILEGAGYKVRTAVDGMEAFALLRAETFDLVVSDVEMPRLNGFDLTARIRADKKLAGLPVVLVTALETREDRERGIDVGANAYIIKSSFEESNLLDAIRQLI